MGRHNIQHNDNQHKTIQRNDIAKRHLHNETQHNDLSIDIHSNDLRIAIQHNDPSVDRHSTKRHLQLS